MYIKGRAPVVIKSIKTGQFMDFDKAKTLTASQTLLSQSLDCFVWSSAASREHSLPFLFLLLFLIGFLWLAVVILHQQRGVGWVFFVSLIFSLLSWAVTVLRPFFPCSYRPELNSSPPPPSCSSQAWHRSPVCWYRLTSLCSLTPDDLCIFGCHHSSPLLFLNMLEKKGGGRDPHSIFSPPLR